MCRFLEKDSTSCINGGFIIIVFISHLRTYMTLTPPLDWLMRAFWQLMVATFLLYSGFGVMESISKKGMDYVRKIPSHRVLGVLIRFIPAVLLFGIVDLILDIKFTWDQFLLSLIAWKNLGNSNWYIFVILCLYIITWAAWMIADRLSKNKKERLNTYGFLILLALSAILIFVLSMTTPEYYYNTISAYLFGVFLSINKERILGICGFNSEGKVRGTGCVIRYIVSLAAIGTATYFLRLFLHRHYSDILFLVLTVLFCMTVVLISYLIPFPDYVLKWFGGHLFEIYILMRLPMIVFQRIPGWEHGGLWYALTCFAVTVIIAWIYHTLTSLIKGGKK